MAVETDVFYGFCTFWTGDWAWLKRMNGYREISAAERAQDLLDQEAAMSAGRPRPIRQPQIPHCPFCGSVGFETDRESWLRQAREWEDGTSPQAGGIPHPGYVAMLMWGEKQCFRNYAAIEQAYRNRSDADE